MRIHLPLLASAILFGHWASLSQAGPVDKAATLVEPEPYALGSVNTGFKASDRYIDTNVNLVAPVWSSLGGDGQLGGGFVYLEPYVSWGEGGEVATSLGLGWRYLFNNQPVKVLRDRPERPAGFFEEGVSIGASLFVDMLDTESDNQFWQLGFGLELATRYVELRGNYYLPLTDRQLAERSVSTQTTTRRRTTSRPQTTYGTPYDNGQGFIVQDVNTSIIATTRTTTTVVQSIFERYEEGLEGWDLEMAVLVPWIDQWCDLKLIGGYFSLENSPFGPQTGATGAVQGWKAGAEVRPVPAVAVTGMWYEDERFLGSDWMVGARLELPFEAGDLGDGKGFWDRIGDAFKPRRRHLAERLGEPVRRQNSAIHLGNSTQQKSKVVSNEQKTSTQVVAQTQQQLVLGLGPSSTDFNYVSQGSITLTGNNGSGAQTINGSLFLNRLNQTVLVPDNGGTALLLSTAGTGSGAGGGTPVGNPSIVGNTIVISNNVFATNPHAGTTMLLNSGQPTQVLPLSLGSTIPGNSNGGTLTLNNGGPILTSGTIIGGTLIRSTSGTLTLTGGTFTP